MVESEINSATGRKIDSEDFAEVGKDNANEISQWNALKVEWLRRHSEADSEQKKFDDAFEAYLTAGGTPVNLTMQEALDDLWYLEAEARGKLDEFISENYG